MRRGRLVRGGGDYSPAARRLSHTSTVIGLGLSRRATRSILVAVLGPWGRATINGWARARGIENGVPRLLGPNGVIYDFDRHLPSSQTRAPCETDESLSDPFRLRGICTFGVAIQPFSQKPRSPVRPTVTYQSYMNHISERYMKYFGLASTAHHREVGNHRF